MLQRTKKEILSELYKKEQRIKDLENKISELHVEVSANEKSQICKLF